MKQHLIILMIFSLINCKGQNNATSQSLEGIKFIASYESKSSVNEDLPAEIKEIEEEEVSNDLMSKMVANMFSFELYFHNDYIIKVNNLDDGNFIKIVYNKSTKKTIEFIKLEGNLTYNETNMTKANAIGFGDMASFYEISKNTAKTKDIHNYKCYEVILKSKLPDNKNESLFYVTDEVLLPRELNMYHGLFDSLPLEYSLSFDDGIIKCKSEKMEGSADISNIDTSNLPKTDVATLQKLMLISMGAE